MKKAQVYHDDKVGICQTFALVGNPNSGKTSLFNALTGLRQKVGNYPGVTVERKEGICYSQHGHKLQVVDLPGAYSLSARSPDERIMVNVLLGRQKDASIPDAVIVVVDASNLERNLYLTTQVLELGKPVIVALNMSDVAQARGLKIDADALSRELGAPVIPCSSSTGQGITALRLAMSGLAKQERLQYPIQYPQQIVEAVQEFSAVFRRGGHSEAAAQAEARLWLTRDNLEGATDPIVTQVKLWQQRFDRDIPGWRSALITQRYAWIGDVMKRTVRRFNPNAVSLTQKLDAVFLHRVWGLFVLVGLMGFLFYTIFALASQPMDWIDGFFTWLGTTVEEQMQAGDLRDLLVNGIIAGVGAVVIFLPQILLLFFFIGLFESTGYMARAAFLLDRIMSKVGLHGRSFIPLLSSYACAVPGIMATRTIESARDRLVTILVAPFMTCSARLPVYLLMIAMLVPDQAGGAFLKASLLLGLYVLGTLTAFAGALLFRKTLLRGASSSMVLELPPYRLPMLRHVILEMWDRAWIFLKRAGTIIFGFSIIFWFTLNFPRPTAEQAEDALAYSFAGRAGHFVEPVFEPIGYDWRISIGILSSMAAREVFVSTMAIIFKVEDNDSEDADTLIAALRNQTRDDGSSLFSLRTTLSILVFFVFALQCISTIAIVRRETNSWFWPSFQFVFMFALAWLSGFAVYQIGGLVGL